MKMRKNVFRIASLLTASAVGFGAFVYHNATRREIDAYTVSQVPTTIDLNDCSESDIRTYYSRLNNLDASERQGTNLLKELKTILKKDQKYLSYGDGPTRAVWQAYEIVDRDWNKSPASAISGYNAQTNKINGYVYGTSNTNVGTNPYVHALYVNRNVDNQQKAWGNHNQVQWGINQEHIWAKSCGFENESPAAGARGDLMHLWAGNGKVNGDTHSNYYYGYVDTTRTYNDAGSYASTLSGNRRGYSKTLGGSVTVFEPQNSDKGDIARAIFYMAARYNYLSGSDSDGIDAGNPNLEIVNNVTSWQNNGYQSTTSTTGKMGVLQDLLEWNRIDPPDEFEIHRNNLCYRNFTNNRNPFIDFPTWANAIWGTVDANGNYNSTPTTFAAPASDSIGSTTTNPVFSISKTQINLEVGDTTTISAMNAEGNITWSIGNSAIASLDKTTTENNGNVTITALSAGSTTITATNGSHSLTCNLTVTEQTLEISLDRSTAGIEVGQTTTLVATTTPNNAQVTWLSSDEDVATVSNGVVTGVAAGTAVITAKLSNDVRAQCTVTVTDSSSTTGEYVKVASYDFSITATTSNTSYSNVANLLQRFNNSSLTDVGLSNIVTGISDMANVYPGYSGFGNYGIKLGTGSANGGFTTLLNRQVSRVVVKAAGWGTEDNIGVGDAATQTPGVAYTSSNPIKTLTFDITASSSVEFDFYKRGFIQSIDFYAIEEATDSPRNHLNNTSPVSFLTADEDESGVEDITKRLTFASLGLENATKYSEPFEIADGITITFAGGNDDGRYYDTGSGIRTYGNGTITIRSSKMLSQVVLTWSGSNKPTSSDNVNVGTYNPSTGVWMGSADTIVFTRPSGSGHWRLQAVQVTYSGQTITVDNVKMVFGSTISVQDWCDIEESWDIDYYGVMFLKKETLNDTYGFSSIAEAYEEGIRPRADVHTNDGHMPTPTGDLITFTARINLTSPDNYGIVYVAAPYIVIDGTHYFLTEMEYSVNTLAQGYIDNNYDTTLSDNALQILATPTPQGD